MPLVGDPFAATSTCQCNARGEARKKRQADLQLHGNPPKSHLSLEARIE
jgi:hypothetical protein